MGTLNAFYVCGTGHAVAAAIRNSFPDAKIESGESFLGVTLADDAFEPPKDELGELSSDLGTDVIWLSFQSVSTVPLHGKGASGHLDHHYGGDFDPSLPELWMEAGTMMSLSHSGFNALNHVGRYSQDAAPPRFPRWAEEAFSINSDSNVPFRIVTRLPIGRGGQP